MDKVEIIVLGGGVTGLTASFLLDIPVVSKGVPTYRGPHYVWKTPETSFLMHKLGISATKKIKIGYLNEKQILQPSPTLLALYKEKIGDPNASMSDCKTELDVFDITFPGLRNILQDQVRAKNLLIEDRVISIKDHTLYGEKTTIKFDILVSTIPLPSLLQLLNKPYQHLYDTLLPLYFLYAHVPPGPVWDYDYSYWFGPEAFYRITPKEAPICELELTTPNMQLPRGWGPITGLTRSSFGRIIKKVDIKLPPHIKTLGRYASWEPRWRLPDTIRAIRRVKEWT